MNNNIFTDALMSNELSGFFELKIIDKITGQIIDSYDETNVIVIDAKEAIIKAISAATGDDGLIKVLKVGEDVGEDVSMTGTPNLNFVDSNPDTIVRTTGSWIDDGFIDDMTLTITSSTSNNTTYTIDTGGVTATTLTLVGTDTIVVETGTSGVSVVGAASNDNPITPVDTYNSGSMTIIYTSPNTFIVGYNNVTSVTFSITINGADLMTYYPTETSKIITSAALHTGNGNVFAYKRFPQKSVSALVDILINWTIKF